MAKPQIKKVKKDSKGVTYYFSDDDGIMCVDIDVEPGVKSVVFQERQCASKWKDCYSRFLLRNVKKQFPDVERLIISGECIYTIDISNMMFPNVKEVIVKDNDSYEPGPYLMTVKDTNDGRKFCLLNTFCSDAGSVIDLKDVTEISSYAFEGCMAGKIINCKDVSTIDNGSFCGYPASMCENNYKDGALVFENMLVDIDAGAEHVTISEEVTISTSKWFNLGNVKELVCEEPMTKVTGFQQSVRLFQSYDPVTPSILSSFLLHLSDALPSGRVLLRLSVRHPYADSPTAVQALKVDSHHGSHASPRYRCFVIWLFPFPECLSICDRFYTLLG